VENGRERMVWRDARGRAVVESHVLKGLGHGVPINEEHGRAGPFMLEAGVSSTARIAKFWGLAQKPVAKKILAAILPEAVIAPAPEPVVEIPLPANDVSADDAPPRLAAYAGGGLRKVIDRALALAGLIKP